MREPDSELRVDGTTESSAPTVNAPKDSALSSGGASRSPLEPLDLEPFRQRVDSSYSHIVNSLTQKAAMRQDIRALIAEVERLRARVCVLEQSIRGIDEDLQVAYQRNDAAELALEAAVAARAPALQTEIHEDSDTRVAPLVGLDGQDLAQRDNEPLPIAAKRTETT